MHWMAIELSIAMVRHPKQLDHWLLRTSHRVGELRLIQAKRLERESFRLAIDRELAWELELRRGKDYIVSSVPRLHLDTSICFPDQESASEYAVEFYVTDLWGKAALAAINADDGNRWVSNHELRNGLEGDCRLNEVQHSLLAAADVIPRG